MNPSVNQFSESSQPSGNPLPESNPSRKSQSEETNNLETTTNTTSADSTEATPAPPPRQQPIPPPSHPMQYRAIGLIRGRYQQSPEQLTRGVLVASDGTAIDAVLLGRVISLVKNHLDLEQTHLWVVYPRTRQADDDLHAQIVGVWEPETLSQTQPPAVDSTLEESTSEGETPSPKPVAESADEAQDGYFSIRGEVIYYSRDAEKVIVKIRQSPRRESERTKFFKLKLKGTLPDRAIGHFWDFQVQLQADSLAIQEVTDIGLLPVKKPRKKPWQKGKGRHGGRNFSKPRPISKGDRAVEETSKPRRGSLPKLIKREDKKEK